MTWTTSIVVLLAGIFAVLGIGVSALIDIRDVLRRKP